MRKAVLINGPPASGKSTITRQIQPLLAIPLLSLDAIKEPLFEQLGTGDRDFNRALTRTSLTIILAIVADLPLDGVVMIEAWFGSSAFEDIHGTLQARGIDRFAEIWCHAPGEILAERYLARVAARHPGHPDESFARELIALAGAAAPLSIGPVLSIDTSSESARSSSDIAAWTQQALDLS